MKACQDPDHPGNKIRTDRKCLGCGKSETTTAWGPWCFECNVKRMDRIDAALTAEATRYGIMK